MLIGEAEQLPDPENRVVLSEIRERRAVVCRNLEIHYAYDDYTTNLGLAAIREVLQISSSIRWGRRTHRPPAAYLWGAGHIMGTTRMGEDPASSVVDTNLQCHDHPNLFIVGSGVHPTGATANPTLTIAALSLRLADHLDTQRLP